MQVQAQKDADARHEMKELHGRHASLRHSLQALHSAYRQLRLRLEDLVSTISSSLPEKGSKHSGSHCCFCNACDCIDCMHMQRQTMYNRQGVEWAKEVRRRGKMGIEWIIPSEHQA